MTTQAVESDAGAADLVAIAQSAGTRRLAWSAQSTDLNTNLVVLAPGTAVDRHVNDEVDVLVVGIDGQGFVIVDAEETTLGPGHVLLIAKGQSRAMRAGETPFAYLTCHRRRAGLWPAVGRR